MIITWRFVYYLLISFSLSSIVWNFCLFQSTACPSDSRANCASDQTQLILYCVVIGATCDIVNLCCQLLECLHCNAHTCFMFECTGKNKKEKLFMHCYFALIIVRSVYQFLMSTNTPLAHRLIWKLKIPLNIKIHFGTCKAGYFFEKKKDNNFSKRNWKGNKRCFCNSNETIKHLLFNWHAKAIWRMVHIATGLTTLDRTC